MAAVKDRKIVVAGKRVREEEFLDALRNNDEDATRLIVQQIKNDARTGASDGLALVSRAYFGRINQFLMRKLGGSREDASETWNDALLRVYTRIGEFDRHKSSFRTWVYNQAWYALLDRKRTLAREHRNRSDESTGVEYPADPGLADHERHALRRAFNRLTDTQRRLMWFTAVAGLRPAELATDGLVGVPQEQVRVYVNRAAEKLLQFYREELEG